MAGEHVDLAAKLAYKRLSERSLVEVNDVLNDIVAERVLNEGERVVGDFGDELDSLRFRSVIDTALENTATVTMSCDFDAVGGYGSVDELVIFGSEFVQTFLDNMVSVQILNQDNNREAKSNDDGVDLDVAFWVSLPRPVSVIREDPIRI